jgi:hypothetical protein
LTFVYNREFEGGGVIKKQVLPLMILVIYLFQVLNIGYFSIYGDDYFKGGLIFIVIQSLILIALNYCYGNKKLESRMQLAAMEQLVSGNCLLDSDHSHNTHLGED